MAYPTVDCLTITRPSSHGPGLLELRLNRPTRKNALNRDLVLALGDALSEAARDDDVRVVLLGGEGGAFCSGADLSTIRDAKPDEVPARVDEFHRLILGIVDMGKPVIAAVTGPAVGFGADLCLACDVRIFSPAGYVEEGFIKIGLMPDGGGTFQLSRFVGPRAFELLALGTRLDASECRALGIANHVVEDAQAEALRMAAQLADSAPLALSKIKWSLVAGHREALGAALAREREGQTALLLSADFAEGVSAFLEKRSPEFTGK